MSLSLCLHFVCERDLQIRCCDGIFKLKEFFMKALQKIFPLTIILYLLSLSCHPFTGNALSIAKPLNTVSADPTEVKGTFTVILFGGAYHDDLETVAFLDIAGDQYTLEPFAPDFDFVIKKGLSAEEALTVAGKFVSFHPSFWKTQLTEIISPGGDIVGFELRPLYLPFVYGKSDVLDIYYWPKKEGKIKVTVTIIPSLKSLKFNPGGDGGFGGRH
jgi:hypothetical protein